MIPTPDSRTLRRPAFAAACATALACFAPAIVPAGIFPDGVNLQPSYYNNGNVNMGWSLMNQQTRIGTVRIEIEPDKVTQARTWISQARSNGKTVIATYHKSSVLGTDSTSELSAAANWWRTNYSTLNSSGSFTVNLSNEWGSHNITNNAFASAYNSAISTVRQVYSGRIVVDIPGWGQETRTAAEAVLGTGGTRINDTNIALSVHIYPSAWNQGRNRWLSTADLDEMGNAGRPCIVGEFGNQGSGSANWSTLTDHARNKGWTLLAWCWNGDGGSMNMVTPSWASNATATSFSTSSYFSTVYNKLAGGSGGGGGGSTDTSDYNFESSTQGWTGVWGNVSSVGISSAQRYVVGTNSLRVSIAKTSSGSAGSAVAVANPSNVNGRTVTFRVWVPSSTAITAIQPFSQTGSGWSWTSNYTTSFTRNAWNTITLNVPNTTPVQRLGVEFIVNGSFTGDCYVDGVDY